MSSGLFDNIERADVEMIHDEFRTKVWDLIQEFFEDDEDNIYEIGGSRMALTDTWSIDYYCQDGVMLKGETSLRSYYHFSTDQLCDILADIDKLTEYV